MREGWRKVRVWDLPTRLFHWLTVILLIILYVTERLDRMDWHVWAGEILLFLVVFRLIWGVVGSETARFSNFVAAPKRAIEHCKKLVRPEPDTNVGHNAAGGWMVLFMIALLLIQCLTGIYVNNDVANEGRWTEVVPVPITDAISDSHTWLWDVLLAAIALHIVAIATYAFAKRHNLVTPMLTGRKPLPQGVTAPRIRGFWRAAISVIVAAGIAMALSIYL